MYSWGANQYGQLGLGNSKQIDDNIHNSSQILVAKIPILIEDLVFEDDFVVDISTGLSHSIALTMNQKVYIWGQSCDYPKQETGYVEEGIVRNINFPKQIGGIMSFYSAKKVVAG